MQLMSGGVRIVYHEEKPYTSNTLSAECEIFSSALYLPLLISFCLPLEVFWPGVFILTILLPSKLKLHMPQELPHILILLPSLPHHPRQNFSLQFPPCIVLTSTYRKLKRVFSRARP